MPPQNGFSHSPMNSADPASVPELLHHHDGVLAVRVVTGDDEDLLVSQAPVEPLRRGVGGPHLEYDAGRAFGNEMMALVEPPDVVVCSTDITAIGVLDAIRLDRRLAVPAQVGVVGFGDIPAASWASHELSTIRLPLAAMIDLAVSTLLAEPGAATTPRRIVVEGEIVVRSTLRGAASRPA